MTLTGRRIVLTRRPEQAEAMASRLRHLGAEVVFAPALDLAPPEDAGPLDGALRELPRYDWVAFTSANAVRATRERLDGLGLSLPPGMSVATVGSATTLAVGESFPEAAVALQPASDFHAEGLLAAFRSRGVSGQRVLLPLSDRARDVLARGLREAGATVDSVVAYRTVTPAAGDPGLRGALVQGIDLVVLASPSAVEGFVALAGDAATSAPVAVIGPVTEAAARSAHLQVAVRAEPSTVDGLLAAISAHFVEKGR